MRRLLVGLGNPGERYAGTRHNLGYEAVERIAREAGAGRWRARARHSLLAEGELEGTPVLLAEPQTYMNRSGIALAELWEDWDVAPEGTIVYFDDIALPLGQIRIRERGSAGGHKGLESILRVLGGDALPRVRLGIRPEDAPEDLSAFVLERFSRAERARVEEMLDRVVAATRAILRDGIAKAMSLYNAPPSE